MRSLALLSPLLLALPACSEEDPGYRWEVTVTAVEDLCNAEPVGYQQTFVYALYFQGSATDIRIDGQSFAQGEIQGCTLTYESPTVGEPRTIDDEIYWVKWVLDGQATVRQGGSACDLPEGVDWDGTETFTIVESDLVDIPAGCTYTMEVTGVYLGHGND